MELTKRFAMRGRPTMHMAVGGEMPANKVPMGAQDQAAFNGLQDTPTGSIAPTPATSPDARAHLRDTTSQMLGSFQPTSAPQLRDGGELHAANGFFGNLRKMILPTDAEKAARQQYLAESEAERKAAMPAPAPAPADAPVPKAISSYAGNTALERRMKAAGLREGGDLRTGQGGVVPGSGSGDKIPAKYEPGEFVVSNDMLDAQPELRGHLRGLREEVLADKGMTPQQADARAVGGNGLRAVMSYEGPKPQLRTDGWQPQNPRFQDTPASLRGAMASNAISMQAEDQRALSSQQSSARQAAYAQDAAAKAIAEADAARAGLNKASPVGAPAPTAPTATAAPTPATPPAPDTRSFLRKGGDGIKSGYEAAKGFGGKAVSVAKSVGPALAAGAGGYGIVKLAENYGNPADDPQGSYQPPAAVNQIPTDGYRAAPAAQPYNFFSDTETGRNLNNLAHALPGVLGGGAVSGVLRAGSGLARATSAAEELGLATAGGAQAAMPGAQAAMPGAQVGPYGAAQTPAPETYPQANARSNARSQRQGDPSSPDLNDEFSNASIENRNPGGKVTKVVGPDGRVSYSGSNVSGEVSFQGANGNALRGRPGGGYVSTPYDGGASLAAARATLRNPDGSSWSAQDNAIMAANLRDGVDKYRGTSRGSSQGGAGRDEFSNLPVKIAAQMRMAKMANEAAARSDTTLRRGQDNNMQIAMAPIELAATMRKYSADIFKAAGGDNAKAARMMQAAGLPAKGFLDAQKAELDNVAHQQAQLKAAREAGKDRFKGDFTKKDKDGNETFDEVRAARAEQLLNQLTGGQFSQMGEAEQQRYQAEARGKADMLSQIRTPKLRGALDVLGNKIGLVNDPVNLSTLPDFSNGRAVRRGLGMTMGVDSGSWDVTDAHGKVHNFDHLDANQIKILENAGVRFDKRK